MKSFWSLISNGKYSVGCTGQTVYVYDENMTESAKFKDLKYTYLPAISPNGDIFVVKSTAGRMAVYSLETMSLIKKFRYSRVDGGQDDGFCFSPDGSRLINIERQGSFLDSAISIYDTKDFELIKQIIIDKDTMVSHIEYDETTNLYYVLGFNRDEKYRVANSYFVAKFDESKLSEYKKISYEEHEFYQSYISLKLSGFTNKSYEWSYIDCPLEQLKESGFSLPRLYSMK